MTINVTDGPMMGNLTAHSESFDLFRDDLGIPHVRAASETALAYGQGWVTAQDRGLQIEADRMRAEERFAEIGRASCRERVCNDV